MAETILIKTQCRGCPRITRTEVDAIRLEEFEQRLDVVQKLFPLHNDEQREAIMGYRSGYYLCPRCWPDEEDDAG